ncbi:Uncharacterized protein HZ326_12162 [Fusarium oxysporum f. sp. albedinis]|nr:Uncharacterized protein HZ326_12162 [Fusarium oxysporum f. sp. albedinis]
MGWSIMMGAPFTVGAHVAFSETELSDFTIIIICLGVLYWVPIIALTEACIGKGALGQHLCRIFDTCFASNTDRRRTCIIEYI